MDSSTDEMECTGVQRGPFHVPRMLERWKKRVDTKSGYVLTACDSNKQWQQRFRRLLATAKSSRVSEVTYTGKYCCSTIIPVSSHRKCFPNTLLSFMFPPKTTA